jgi:hypothetical protein
VGLSRDSTEVVATCMGRGIADIDINNMTNIWWEDAIDQAFKDGAIEASVFKSITKRVADRTTLIEECDRMIAKIKHNRGERVFGMSDEDIDMHRLECDVMLDCWKEFKRMLVGE